MQKNNSKTVEMVQLALFSAIIIIMAFVPFLGYIPLGFMNATIIHVPVIIASVVLGYKKGAFLGFLFGLTSLLNNTFKPNLTSFVFTPFYSIGADSGNLLSLVICFVPRILVGVIPCFVYRGITKGFAAKKWGEAVGLASAGLAGALTNTLLVMNMIYLFFGNSYAAAKGLTIDALYGVILGVIGAQGVPEAIVAAIFTLTIGGALLKFRGQNK